MSLQITINDRLLNVEQRRTILQAARENDIYIPTLCDYPGLPPHGSCRMCVVEIKGKLNTPTACTTPVEDGMVVQTNSLKIQELRGELLQMLLADHPSSCLFCPERTRCDECMVTLRKSAFTTGCRSCAKDNQCELQTMVDQMGLSQQSYPGRYRMLKVKKSDPFFDMDYNLCILCGRCIRTCDELHFTNTLAYTKRGSSLVVGTAHNRTQVEAGCSFCGACVEACPTGALTEKTRKWDGKAEQETISTCPFCSIGCQIRLLSSRQSLIGSLPARANGQDSLCVLGRFGITELVNFPTRLSHPSKTVGKHSLEISWDETIRLAADKLNQCAPGRFALRISNSCTNEDLYIAQKFTRQVMKSDGFQITGLEPYLGSFPFLSKWLGQARTLAAIDQADTILALGFDGKYAQSPVEVKIHQAKKRGARLVTVHALAHSLDRFADVWLHPEAGEETKWLEALVSAIDQPVIKPPHETNIARASVLIKDAHNLVIALGPAFLTHPDAGLLAIVEKILNLTGAQIILLPDQGNLIGAMLISGLQPPVEPHPQAPDVLYLIGGPAPEDLTGNPFIVFQNIYPPDSNQSVDLTLPTAAFSETEGSFVDYTGGLRKFHPAVQAPGTALSVWETLCKIAQQMGFSDFDYQHVAEIQAELNEKLAKTETGNWINRMVLSGSLSKNSGDPHSLNDHLYLGIPLVQYVEGLRMLYPDEANPNV